MRTEVEAKLTDRVEALRRSLIGGLPFESAVELLPALPRRSAAERPSPSEFPARALTGCLQCNNQDLPSVPRFDGGFDGGCVVNYFGTWKDDRILDLFDTWKTSAKNFNERQEDYYVSYKNIRYNVLPFGSNRGVNFKYILKTRGFTFLIFGKADSGELPTVQVDFSYESLRGRSLFDARKEAEDVLLSLGFRWDRLSFQRIDINVTVAIPFEKIASAFVEGRLVSRVRNFATVYNNRSSGSALTYVRGGSDVQICLYDKYYELQKHYNEQKFNDLSYVLGDGQDLTRVEFRLSSAFFHSLDVSTFEDLEKELPSIVEYLCFDWFRIVDGKKVRGREKKQKLDIYWQYIQYAFDRTFIKNDDLKPIVRRKRYNCENSRLLRQAVGCVSSALARTFDPVKNIDEFINDVFETCLRYKRLAYRAYQRKKVRYEVLFSNG